MSRRCTFRSRPFRVLTARRLTLATLVVAVAWSAAAQEASAQSLRGAPMRVVTGHGGGGGQVAAGGTATARQFQSGNGKFNQNLNGVFAPTFMIGQQQTGITNGGRISTQGAFCGPGPRKCKIWQNMPINASGW
ncbi:hypothetical protein Msi02_37290 [Microbispora siamensis]|uniref:Uncharacterized protein n=2 Tax=Microbispora siamensis TaxID=564413 RepID=A0ABQ4GNA6_9ACTN|nr:hypothetical protein Msi02_37290 [Microbispora siamensis]